MKIILAYSGGLDTSVLVHWYAKSQNAEVITYCADVGQEEELDGLEEKALATGATAHRSLNLVDEFSQDFIYPMVRGNAIYESQYLLGTSIARPLIAKAQIEIAREFGLPQWLMEQPEKETTSAVLNSLFQLLPLTSKFLPLGATPTSAKAFPDASK